jgi:hypothetical protein
VDPATAEHVMSGRHSRQKGKRGEQEVANLLKPLFPYARTKRAGGESASADRGRDLLGTGILVVQVKLMAAPAPIKALREASAAATDAEMPVAFCKQTRCAGNNAPEWTVTLRAKDFLALAMCAGIEIAGNRAHVVFRDEVLPSMGCASRDDDEAGRSRSG